MSEKKINIKKLPTSDYYRLVGAVLDYIYEKQLSGDLATSTDVKAEFSEYDDIQIRDLVLSLRAAGDLGQHGARKSVTYFLTDLGKHKLPVLRDWVTPKIHLSHLDQVVLQDAQAGD